MRLFERGVVTTSNGDDRLRQAPGELSMSPTQRRGRVRLTLSPAEEKKRIKALERKEQMLTEDIRMAGALLEMIEAKLLPRAARAMPSVMEGPTRAYRHRRGRWRGWLPKWSVVG